MPTFATPLALYNHQKRAFEDSLARGRSGPQSWRQIPEGAYRDFQEFTSGGISSATLRRAGHPYARQGSTRRGVSAAYRKRNPGLGSTKGFAPLLPINRQSSALYNSITLYRRSSRYNLEESVGFDAAKAGKSIYAVSPKGTRYVVPRGIWTQIRKRGMARNRAYNDVFFRQQRQAFAKP